MDTVEIQKRKLSGGSGTWGVYVLDRDEHGTWFFAPLGTQVGGRSLSASTRCAVRDFGAPLCRRSNPIRGAIAGTTVLETLRCAPVG